jgi:hypothetical protein
MTQVVAGSGWSRSFSPLILNRLLFGATEFIRWRGGNLSLSHSH